MKNKKKLIFISIISFLVIGLTISGILIYRNHLEKLEKEQIILEYNKSRQDRLNEFIEETKTLSNVDVSFVGDSLTHGCDISKYYSEYNAINRGIGGDTTFDILNRMECSIYDVNPKVLVLLIGGNNLDTMLTNYEDIITLTKSHCPSTKIIMCSLTAMGKTMADKNDLALRNNVVLKQIAIRNDCEFVDLFTPLYDSSTNEIKESYTTDGAHLTNEGYIVVSNAIKPYINKLLNEG